MVQYSNLMFPKLLLIPTRLFLRGIPNYDTPRSGYAVVAAQHWPAYILRKAIPASVSVPVPESQLVNRCAVVVSLLVSLIPSTPRMQVSAPNCTLAYFDWVGLHCLAAC